MQSIDCKGVKELGSREWTRGFDGAVYCGFVLKFDLYSQYINSALSLGQLLETILAFGMR
jgi:hypothetical protein